MSQEDIFINGELLRLRREARGWVLSDMATRACMSVKQIRQIEEGGMSSFYSTAVKVTAAKKAGALLGLSAEEVFAQTVEPVVSSGDTAVDTPESQVELSTVTPELADAIKKVNHAEPASALVAEELQPGEVLKSATDSEQQGEAYVAEESKYKTSLWLVAALLALTWAGATYWQPQEEPVTEPIPPLQVLPAEDPASGASAAEGTASIAADAAATASSMPTSAVTANVVIAPALASVVRPVSALAALPAASSASKAP